MQRSCHRSAKPCAGPFRVGSVIDGRDKLTLRLTTSLRLAPVSACYSKPLKCDHPLPRLPHAWALRPQRCHAGVWNSRERISLSPVFAHGQQLGSPLSCGDVRVHHAIELGLHTTVLVWNKAALNGSSSKLLPDKGSFGYGFPCDGPGRGGTCDISAWDGFYLAAFWMLNTIGWVTFYWHWKHIMLVTNNLTLWTESSTYLMGWLRDYLWFNSSQLINGYFPLGVTKNAVWDWMFLFGHLIWATGFMFLISWRGYWQELIESIVWAHEQTPLANLIVWSDKPIAPSIVPARFVGLAHFAIGYVLTYGPFVMASSSSYR